MDGGIGEQIAPMVVSAGASVLVAGSAVFFCMRRPWEPRALNPAHGLRARVLYQLR